MLINDHESFATDFHVLRLVCHYAPDRQLLSGKTGWGEIIAQ
jgi:hypothetical protein